MKNKRFFLLSVLMVLVLSVILGVYFFNTISQKAEAALEELDQMVLNTVDLKDVPNGKYEGRYEAFPVKVKVRVHVLDHAITEIELLKHRNGQGKEAEEILERMLKAQNINVETISGATYSSKVIQKAVERALLSSLDD